MAFKMKGFSGFGNLQASVISPAKKSCNCWDGYSRVPGTKPCAPGSCKKDSPAKAKVSEYAASPRKEEEKEKSDLTLAKEFITKPKLYKSKNLSLTGDLGIGEGTEFGWDSSGNITPFGSPTINFKNTAGLSGEYKLGKNTTLTGGVNWATGSKPQYNYGLKINL